MTDTNVLARQTNDLDAFWLPFTPNRAFKRAPRLISRAKDMHYFTPDGRAVLDGLAGLWCSNAGHNRDPDRRRDPAPGGGTRLLAGLPVCPPQGVFAGEPDRRAGAGRSQSRVLLQFRLGGVRYRAQDRARLPSCARGGHAHAVDRPRARLSRRRVRRHFRRRHGQQSQVLRHAVGRRRSSAGDL